MPQRNMFCISCKAGKADYRTPACVQELADRLSPWRKVARKCGSFGTLFRPGELTDEPRQPDQACRIAAKNHASRSRRRVDYARQHGGHERLHRLWLPQGRAAGPGQADGSRHRGGQQVPPARMDRRLHRPRAGRRPGQGGRHRVPPALQLRPHRPRDDQQRQDGVFRHAPQPSRPDGLAGLPRPAGHGADRGFRHHRGRLADPLLLRRQ